MCVFYIEAGSDPISFSWITKLLFCKLNSHHDAPYTYQLLQVSKYTFIWMGAAHPYVSVSHSGATEALEPDSNFSRQVKVLFHRKYAHTVDYQTCQLSR